MERTCQRCGKAFTAGPRALYCGSTCRARASEDRRSGTTSPPAAMPQRGSSGQALADRVRAELDAAGRLGTTAGETALLLARRLEAGDDAGSAVASLARQLLATMSEALRDSQQAADVVDELSARRDARRGA